MRILQLSHIYYPFLDLGGPAGKVKAIAERMAQRGHEVTVVTSNHGSRRTVTETIGGVEVVYLAAYGSYRSATLNPGIVRFSRRRLQAFDVAHVYGLYDLLGPAGAFACRETNGVNTAHRFIRVALVHDEKTTREGMTRLAAVL